MFNPVQDLNRNGIDRRANRSSNGSPKGSFLQSDAASKNSHSDHHNTANKENDGHESSQHPILSCGRVEVRRSGHLFHLDHL